MKAVFKGIIRMSQTINDTQNSIQGQSTSIESFVLFRFQGKLGKGVKSRIKSHGCLWNPLLHGWLCLISKQKDVQSILLDAKLDYENRIVSLPKGMISSDPKISSRQTRLEILEQEAYNASRQLLEDVYRYDSCLRPEEFSTALTEEGKTLTQIQLERDFHYRFVALEEQKDEIEKLRKELVHLTEDPGEKILDHQAPLKIAEELIQAHYLYEKHRILLYCSNAFWLWNGTKYIEIEEGAIRQSIYNFLKDAKELGSDGYLESFNPTKHKVDQIVDALKAICYFAYHPSSGSIWLDGRQMPNPKYLVSFSNGILPIEDWLEDHSVPLMKHTPLLLNVNSLNFDFDSSAIEPYAWLEFLNLIWENDFESIETLQEWCGYVLTQDTRQHKILLIVGPPRSGKGTIGRVFRELLGHFNVVGPTLSSLGGEFGLQPLLNQMLALISDARLNDKRNSSTIIERLLSISGEDPLTINRKFLEPLTTQLPTRIMMMSNELPDLRDSSGAMAKRYLVLTLKKSWVGKEDISLFSRLTKELPGILMWALKGLIRLKTRGHFLTPTSSAQTTEYRRVLIDS